MLFATVRRCTRVAAECRCETEMRLGWSAQCQLAAVENRNRQQWVVGFGAKAGGHAARQVGVSSNIMSVRVSVCLHLVRYLLSS